MSKIGAGAGLLGLAAALGIYVLAGLMKVPFHPDEAMQLHMSRDFDRLLAEGPLALVTRPPYEVDSDDFLRILNGSIHRHVVGALRTALGLGPELLPPAPGWDWRYDVRANRQLGFFPKPELLVVGRLASAIFLALAGAVALLLGRALGQWSIGAGFAALLLANPVVLLNGRRALQEGSMLLFGLLAVLAAALLARRMAEGGRPHPALWLFFAVASGLCLASKHPGLCFVLSGAAIVASAWLPGLRPPTTPQPAALALALAGAAAIFLVLSPALWLNPPARLADLIRVRAVLVAAQGDELHPSLAASSARLFTMPFIEPPQFFETADVASDPLLRSWAGGALSSPLSGLPTSGVLGWLLTLLAAAGMASCVLALKSPRRIAIPRLAPAIWWIVTAGLLLANPLPWQRYYLPLIPPSALLAVLGLGLALRTVKNGLRRVWPVSPALAWPSRSKGPSTCRPLSS